MKKLYLITFGSMHYKVAKLDNIEGSFDDALYFDEGRTEDNSLNYRIQEGRELLDCHVSSGTSTIVSKRFKDFYEQCKLTGLSFTAIKIMTNKGRQKRVEYFLIRPTKFSKSFHFLNSTPAYTGGISCKGIVIDSDLPDTDFFSVDNTGLVFISDSARQLFENSISPLTGIHFFDAKNAVFSIVVLKEGVSIPVSEPI